MTFTDLNASVSILHYVPHWNYSVEGETMSLKPCLSNWSLHILTQYIRLPTSAGVM